MKIISANYNDRNSPFHWLVRDANQSPKEAVAVKTVYATEVEFKESSTYELGFGCKIVAYCKTADEHNEPVQPATGCPKLQKLNFGQILLAVLFANQTTKVGTLYLDADGHMFGSTDVPVSQFSPATEEVLSEA